MKHDINWTFSCITHTKLVSLGADPALGKGGSGDGIGVQGQAQVRGLDRQGIPEAGDLLKITLQ